MKKLLLFLSLVLGVAVSSYAGTYKWTTNSSNFGTNGTSSELQTEIGKFSITISSVGTHKDTYINCAKSSKFTLTAPEGCKMTKVVFNVNETGKGFATNNANYTHSGYVGTWENASGENSISLTATGGKTGNQVHIKSIEITTAGGEVINPDPDPEPDPDPDPNPSTDPLLDLAFNKHTAEYAGWSNSYSNSATIKNETASIYLSGFSKQTQTLTDYPVTKTGYAILSVVDPATTITSIAVVAKQWSTKAKSFSIYTSEDGTTYSSEAVATCSNFELKSTQLGENVKYVKIQFTNSSNQIGLCSVSYTIGKDEIVQQAYELPQGAMTMAVGESQKINLGSKFPAITFTAPENGIVSVDKDGNVKALKGGNGKIALSWEETEKWIGGNAEIDVTVTRKDYTQAFADVVMRVGETVAVNLGAVHPDVKLVSDNAAVTVADGKLTAVSAGEATITASWAEDDEWNGGEKSFKVTVKEPVKPSNVGFQHTQVNGIVGHPVAWQAADASGDGNLTYSVSPAGIVSIDAATGALTALSAGTATVTAKIGATDNYSSATATYTVVITENPAAQPAETATARFDFTKEDAYGLYTFDANSIGETSSTNNGLMESNRPVASGNPVTSVKSGAVTIAFDGDYRLFCDHSEKKGDSYDLRLYKPAQDWRTCMTFSAGSSKIKSITFSGYVQSDITCQVDWIDVSPEYGDNATIYNIPEGYEYQIELFTKDKAEVRLIDVELYGGASGKKAPELVFDKKKYSNFLADNAAKTIAVSHADGINEKKISYTIDNLSADDYIAEADGNGGVDLLVYTPGVWTLRAEYPGDVTTVAGAAVMRLNVFPRIVVDSDNKFHAAENYVVLEADGGNVSVGHDHGNVFHCYIKEDEKFFGKYETNLAQDETYNVNLKYGDIDDFSSIQTVHAILRPAKPYGDLSSTVVTGPEDATLYWRVAPVIEQSVAARAASLVDFTGWESLGDYYYDFSQKPDQTNKVLQVMAVKDAENVEGLQVPSEILHFAFNHEGIMTGIENVAVDGNAGEAEFFNLQGVRVSGDEPGIYLRRQAGKVEKVVIR